MRKVAFVLVVALVVAVPVSAEPVFRGLSWGDPVEALGEVERTEIWDSLLFAMCHHPYSQRDDECYHSVGATLLVLDVLDRSGGLAVYDGALDIAVYVDSSPDPLGSVQPAYILYLVVDDGLAGIMVSVLYEDSDAMRQALQVRYGVPSGTDYKPVWTQGDLKIEFYSDPLTHHYNWVMQNPTLSEQHRATLDAEDKRLADEELLAKERAAKETAYSW